MPRRIVLNARQRALLERIAAGPESVTSRESEMAVTVYALRNRGLVTTLRRGGTWTAVLTEAGQTYLEHGSSTTPSPTPAPSPTPRRAARPVERTGAQAGAVVAPADLIARISAAGGTLRIADPDSALRSAWRRSVQGAIRAGQRVHYTGRTHGDIVIVLPASNPPHDTGAAARPTRGNAAPASPRPGLTSFRGIHPLTMRLTTLCFAPPERGERPDLRVPSVTTALIPRALDVLDALFTRAESRGHQAVPASRADGLGARHPSLRINSQEYPLTITEYRSKLALRLLTTPGRHRTWNDGRRHLLEARIDEVLDWCEANAAEAEQRREERTRTAAVQAQTLQDALERARAAFAEDYQRDALRRQADDWRLAGEIRAMCTALRTCLSHSQSTDSTAAAWLAWAGQQADRLDPLTTTPTIPHIPEPTQDQLADYLAADPVYCDPPERTA